MKTLLEVLKLSTQHLQKSGIAEARRQAEELISDALDVKRMQLYLDHDRPLQESELALIRERLARRSRGEPNAYIHGEVEFLDCRLKVTPDVLIPRQETAILVEMTMRFLEKQDLNNKVLLDLCCGSGYIAIALKKRFPELHVLASDICPKALAIARENAERNACEVEFLEGDFLEPVQGRKIDYILFNPPYASEEEYEGLEREVKDFEPYKALVGGVTGLEFYERLAREVPAGTQKVWMEISDTQGEALSRLFPGGQLLQDWSGKDRFYIFPSS